MGLVCIYLHTIESKIILSQNHYCMDLTSVIYVRTPQGRATAFSPSAALPAGLKDMLKAVDGKLTAQALQDKFADQTDPAKLLSQLLDAGLIMDRGAAWPKIELRKTAADFEHSFVEFEGSLLEAGSSLPPHLSAQSSAHSGADGANGAGSPKPNWTDTSPSGIDQLAPPPVYSLLDRMAQQAADEMCTFVLTHLPVKAFGLLATIEKIKTPDQLKSYMPSYQTELAELGVPGQTHCDEMSLILKKLF
jgi:hypothetical protein